MNKKKNKNTTNNLHTQALTSKPFQTQFWCIYSHECVEIEELKKDIDQYHGANISSCNKEEATIEQGNILIMGMNKHVKTSGYVSFQLRMAA